MRAWQRQIGDMAMNIRATVQRSATVPHDMIAIPGGTFRMGSDMYYPEEAPHTPENDLYLALAQVIEKSNLSAGIRRLTAAIERHSPQRAEYYLELAEALRNNGQFAHRFPAVRFSIFKSLEGLVSPS